MHEKRVEKNENLEYCEIRCPVWKLKAGQGAKILNQPAAV